MCYKLSLWPDLHWLKLKEVKWWWLQTFYLAPDVLYLYLKAPLCSFVSVVAPVLRCAHTFEDVLHHDYVLNTAVGNWLKWNCSRLIAALQLQLHKNQVVISVGNNETCDGSLRRCSDDDMTGIEHRVKYTKLGTVCVGSFNGTFRCVFIVTWGAHLANKGLYCITSSLVLAVWMLFLDMCIQCEKNNNKRLPKCFNAACACSEVNSS